MPGEEADRVRQLTAINLDDMWVAFGWEKIRFARKILTWLFGIPARRFTNQVLDFDRDVAENGLQNGSRQFLAKMGTNLVIESQQVIPSSGPVLFLANHPGMTDTISLFASIPRPDLSVVAADRPFLRLLYATGRQLIFVSELETQRIETLRTVAGHLRSGSAVLTFPAGHIEPDPAILPGAMASLDDWSPSIGVFARLVPQTTLVPVIVSGVLSAPATFHPLTHLRRKPKDRERLGATLQILARLVLPELWPSLWRVTVRIRFGEPIQATNVVSYRDPMAITREVIAYVKPFMRQIVEMESLNKCRQ